MLDDRAFKEISMRYLISSVFFVAAALAYMFGVGPAFFGAPLLGSALLLLGLGLEISAWRRLRRVPARTSSRAPTDR
jgi:hypothetical protein